MLTLSLHALFFMLSLVLLLFQDTGLFIVVFGLCAALAELTLWARREQRMGTLNWCHPVPAFTLGYCIVYYQLPFSYLAGFDLSYYSNYVILAPYNIAYCVILAAMGLSAFFCGEQFIYLKRRRMSYDGTKAVVRFDPAVYSARIRRANSFVLAASTVSFLLYLKSIGFGSYLGYSYGSGLQGVGLSPHFALAYTIFLYLAILLEITRLLLFPPTSLCSYLRSWDVRVLAVTLVTILPAVISGDRGAYLQPLALLSVPFFIFVKRMKLGAAIAVTVIFAFLLVLIGDTRGRQSVNWKVALDSRVEAITNPAQWPTMELANSFGTFNIATAYFPEHYPYNNGLNMFYRVTSLVPLASFFTEVDKKNRENDYIFTSGLFFTNILTRGTFSSGSGTSSLADLYMDFGPYGIPFVLFAWGAFIGWIARRTLINHSAIFVFLYAYYAYFCIYVNRSSFFFGWNNFVWVILLYDFIRRLYLARRIPVVTSI